MTSSGERSASPRRTRTSSTQLLTFPKMLAFFLMTSSSGLCCTPVPTFAIERLKSESFVVRYSAWTDASMAPTPSGAGCWSRRTRAVSYPRKSRSSLA